jgi:excisionase family DNA binding protein
MAGMFYSLQEITEKLNTTKEEIEELVRNGRLREFRDGPNLLFKIDEVEALMSDTGVMASEQSPEQPQEQTEEEQIFPEPEPESEPTEIPPIPIAEDELIDEDTAAVADEDIDTAEETDIDSELTDDTKADTSAETPLEKMSLEPEPTETPLEEISLEPESTEPPAAEKQLTEADTVITGKETDALAETDSEYKIKDDIMGETKTGSGEVSLEEIEEDVNLDTFGSGSGLLDLSLQADDTSLGGVLDEIYTSEGGEGGEEQEAEKESETEEATEAEQILPEDSAPEAELPLPAIAQAYAEPEPDKLNNALGIMMVLPLLAVVYTAIVTMSGFSATLTSIREKTQGIIWYIAIALAVAAILIVGMPFVLGGKPEKKPKAKKPKKKKDKGPAQPEQKA